MQATPESPIPQVHPGDATDVTTLAELFVVGGADAEESVELVEPTSFTDGAGAEESVELVESSGNNDAYNVRLSLVEPVASDGAGAEQSVELVESRAVDGAGAEESVELVESCVAAGGAGDERSPGGQGWGGGTGWGYLHTVLKLMRASSHPGRGELADAEEIGQRLRGARGAG